jgi:hypothetical protein
MPRALLVLLLVLSAPAASADGAASSAKRHAIYAELLGKGGLYGVGYDYQVEPWLAVGTAVSYAVLDGQHVATWSPYFGFYLLGRKRHRWFAHAGPQFVYLNVPSYVPEWPGRSSLDAGAQLTTGYEYRGPLLVRFSVLGVAGRGGFVPWLGLSLGWAR